jgi:hypothetical protein
MNAEPYNISKIIIFQNIFSFEITPIKNSFINCNISVINPASMGVSADLKYLYRTIIGSLKNFKMSTLNWKFSNIFVIVLFSLSIFMVSCGDDDPIVETKTRMYGTITIENHDVWETWQDSGEVQLTLFPEFSLDPMAGWGEVPDDFFFPGSLGGTFAVGAPYNSQNPIVIDYVAGQNIIEYSIEIEAGTYSALALGFRNDNVVDASLKTATLGVYWENPSTVSHGVVIRIQAGPMVIPIFNYPAPSTIVLAEGEELQLDFKADFDFVNQWYN